MAVTNHDRVGKAMELLREGLEPYCERYCSTTIGADWRERARDVPGRVSDRDVQFLLKVMLDFWREVFDRALGRSGRTLVHELLDIRNAWAHQEQFSTDDTYRAIDSAHRLLRAVSAEQAEEVDKLKQDLLRTKYAEEARSQKRKAAATPLEGMEVGGVIPWRDVVTPHEDVATGRYQQAEFAADLAQVHGGAGSEEYRDPVEFFRRTFLTQGLHQLLVQAVQRLHGVGGVPVVDLQTNFGGGKTHSLLALYHACSGISARGLSGVDVILESAGVKELPRATRAVIVGTAASPGAVHPKPDSTIVRTLWGEIAWQLGGPDGYAMVAEADATSTSPGSTRLSELFEKHGPCLVLIDEWVAYARQLYGKDDLPAGTFDTHFTFAQALTEAARAAADTLVVVSIPASARLSDGSDTDIEIGGEGGRAALERLKNVIGRMESPWRPASAEESFEIVRRRLFQEIDAQGQAQRDAVASRFAEVYRSEREEFPQECREGAYERRIQAAYPIHPELFDRLYEDWSTLERFQRTRGVLRLMAAVIHELWGRGDQAPLIMPSSVPIDDPAVFPELTRYLEDNWKPVIERDVDGTDSLPVEIDRANPNLQRHSACRRVARTIYLGSAPTVGSQVRGVDDRRIKLGCVLPGERSAVYGDALRRLAERSTFLYSDGTRYWYATQPSVARMAEDRAAQYSADEVREEIIRRLRQDSANGDFAAVHRAPESPEDVPDEPEARLVILSPEQDHSSKTADSLARAACGQLLEQRRGGPRRYRNMLVFLAPDRSRLDELRQAVRQYLAWQSISGEATDLDLEPSQSVQATRRRDSADETVRQRLGETYVWLITPTQKASADLEWEEKRVQGTDPLAVRASKKLMQDEGLITRFAPVRLRMELDNVPLWRGDHVFLRQVWEDFAQYLYLPRLRDESVLMEAVKDGPGLVTWRQDGFAYAAAFDESADRYRGLLAGSHGNVAMDAQSVLVRPDVAVRQVGAEEAIAVRPGGTDSTDTGGEPTVEEEEGSRQPSRFYGRIALDPLRMGTQAGQVAEAVVQHLSGLVGAEVEVMLEISGTVPEGVPENVVRTVTENARTLNFDSHGFEDER